MTQPVTLSGRGSKVAEVELPQGNYRLSWNAQHDEKHEDYGEYVFQVILEENELSDLAKSFLNRFVDEIFDHDDSGEAFARLPGGMHIFSVKASHLDWTISFTPL
jgi:hypothetical protein